MRQPAILTLAALALAGCAPQPEPEAAAVAMGRSVDCINPDFIVSRYPAGDTAIVFEMTGGVTYRNDLLSTCPNLSRRTASDTWLYEIEAARLCVNDEVRVFDPIEAQAAGAKAYPACRLGRFTRIPTP